MQNNYDTVGAIGTLDVLLRSMHPLALPALPYIFFEYRTLLRETHTLSELADAHRSLKQISIPYALAGPLHRKYASRALSRYGVH